ncbi:hypothetical protein [Larkinella rosea]|uniref:Energy transducer TonB n=1 Tax=Larkinella rosea TaxID=2025312 RepID=A0A3P1C297_9BACT|nr:hypothetical protein [Larkinella rosea]RRB06924.1 hypothetical protein EHT25_03815 [Larkinella rosea]
MSRVTLENENEYRVTAFAGSFAVCALLFFLLLYIRLWQSVPDPPPIQLVEVNFGTDLIGSGSIQTYNKANDSKNKEDVKKEEDKPNPKVTTTSRVEKTPVSPVPKIVDAKVSKVVTEKPDIASKIESPVTVPEKAEPKKVEATTPKPTPAPPKAEPVPEPKKVDANALYKKGSSGGSNGTVGKASGIGGNNNGDDASGVGDKGNPDGNINAKQFYGTPGGTGSGVSLNISGWRLGSTRLATDNSGESGKIVFEIKVDDKGDVTFVKVKETRLSPTVTEFYKQQVYKLQLVQKASVAPPISTGIYTINIRSN